MSNSKQMSRAADFGREETKEGDKTDKGKCCTSKDA